MILSTMTGGISRKLGDEQAIKMLADAGYDAYDFTFDAHPADSPIYTDDNVDYFKQLQFLTMKTQLWKQRKFLKVGWLQIRQKLL